MMAVQSKYCSLEKNSLVSIGDNNNAAGSNFLDFHRMTSESNDTYKILPMNLCLVSIQRKQFHFYSKALLKTLFVKLDSPNRFISFIETTDEISIILDEESLEGLKRYKEMIQSYQLNMDAIMLEQGSIWRGILIRSVDTSSGLSPANEHTKNLLEKSTPRSIYRYASILSANNISIFYHSLWTCDLLLVEEENFDKAVELIQNKVENADRELTEEQLVPPSMFKRKREPSEEENAESYDVESEELTALSENLCMCRLSRDQYQFHIKDMLNILWFEYRQLGEFFALASFEDENIIVANEKVFEILSLNSEDEKECTALSEGCQKIQFVPVMIHTSEGLGFDEAQIGVVSKLTGGLLSHSNPTSVIYFSTFVTDYILIQQEQLDSALNHLKEV